MIVAAHLGRPKGAPDPKYSLRPVADRLAQLLGRPVEFALDTVGESARLLADELGDGELLLLENVRFNAGETSKDDAERHEFARRAGPADRRRRGRAARSSRTRSARSTASTRRSTTSRRCCRSYCGNLVRDELAVLRRLTGEPDRPYVVVLGGSKVSDKLAVIDSLLPKVDKLLVGGGMCFTFLAALGNEVGDSLLETDQIDNCARLLDARRRQDRPADRHRRRRRDLRRRARPSSSSADEIPAGAKGLDIGPGERRARSPPRWPMPGPCSGTARWACSRWRRSPPAPRGVAEAVAATKGLSVVGGGDSAAAVRALGLDEVAFGHISTGGGASLEFLEGKPLPGVDVLEQA